MSLYSCNAAVYSLVSDAALMYEDFSPLYDWYTRISPSVIVDEQHVDEDSGEHAMCALVKLHPWVGHLTVVYKNYSSAEKRKFDLF